MKSPKSQKLMHKKKCVFFNALVFFVLFRLLLAQDLKANNVKDLLLMDFGGSPPVGFDAGRHMV